MYQENILEKVFQKITEKNLQHIIIMAMNLRKEIMKFLISKLVMKY